MELREIRSFILLAEQLHFGRAARLLNLSQPALTKQIRKLEESLGAQLFERGTHGTRLSSFGSQFLKESRHAVQIFDQLIERAERAASGETGRLLIGFGFQSLDIVSRLVAQLRLQSPGIEVSLRDMSTAEQIDALKTGEIDLGFGRRPLPAGVETLPVVSGRLALIASSALGLPEEPTLADCAKLPFVTLSERRSPGLFRHTLRLCAKQGFHPRIIQQVPELPTVLALVRAGLGVALIAPSLWVTPFEEIRSHTLADKEAEWSIDAFWRKGDFNPARDVFLKLLRHDLAAGR